MTYNYSRYLVSLTLILLSIKTVAQNSGASITGFVYQDSSIVLEGATVNVKNNATGFTASAITDKKGYFSLREIPVGVYDIKISFINFQTKVITGNQLNLGDRLVLNKIELSKSEGNMLSEVTVTSSSFTNSIDRLGTGTAVTSRAIQKIPIISRNYQDLMQLSPLSNGASLAGANPGGTGYTLDGISNRWATFGGLSDAAFSISSETIKEFEVSTNSYDVTNGRGSGGTVKAITKSGTNTFSGEAWGYYGANSLAQQKNVYGNPIITQNKIFQAGALLSGPIIKDKIHFVVSYDRYEKTLPFAAYDFSANGADQLSAEKALGVTKSELDSVVSIMNNQFGFPKGPQYGPISIKQKTETAFGKIDWNINPKNLLTVRYNYMHLIDPNKLKGNGLLSTEYIGVETQHSFLISLRSELSNATTNELKLAYSTYRKNLDFLYNRVPEGFVNVTPYYSDGTTGPSKQVAFGNQNWVPERDVSRVVSLVDNLRYRAGSLNFVFGTDNNINFIADQLSHDQQGQFYYNSITNMANNNAYLFNRKIDINGDNPPVNIPLIELGLYAQMETNLKPNLNLTVGLRWDANIIAKKPTYNAQLDKDLGVRTDVAPFDAKNIQPRANLIWDINNNGKDIVKIGAGLFASELTTQPLTFAQIDNGVDYRQITVQSGGSIPIPTADWQAYQSNFNLVPGADYLKSLPANTILPATVLLMDKHLKNPLTFKTNLSYYHYINNWLRVGGNLYFNNTWDNFYLYDLNLKNTPDFVTNEGRAVYVPASTLTTGTSALPQLQNSRISANFNQVRYFTNAKWAAKFIGAMVEASAKIGRDGSFNLSYATGKATGAPPYDNGDPRNANFPVADIYLGYTTSDSYGKNWRSSYDQPNKIVALLLSPTFYGFSISSSFQAYESTHYSAFVNQDVIGEANAGVDLAYIYDPNDSKTPSAIATDMKTLLQNTSSNYRKFLEENFGKFAAYNGGLMPWRTQWNLSISKEFSIYKTHKITLRADLFNVLNLLNYKWGGYTQIINTNLYSVGTSTSSTGLIPGTTSYNYTVNTNAGGLQKVTLPYSIQFGIKYSF